MTSQLTVTLTLLVMATSAVQGLPTGTTWEDGAEKTTPTFVTEISFLQETSSEEVSTIPEDVPSPDEEDEDDDNLQEGCKLENSMKSPPEVMLEDWQIKEILNTSETVILNDSAILRNQDNMNRPIVNITEEQMAKLLPYYRALFNRPLEQPVQSSESRARRTTAQRICPSDPVITQPELGINGNGGLVQIVQLNSLNMSQVFLEEKCLHESSPISAATCVQATRLVTALVIDFQTLQIEQQSTEIQCCVGVLYI